MTTITTTIPFSMNTARGKRTFGLGANPADDLDIAHPFVARLLGAELLTIEVDEPSTKDEAPAKAAKTKAKGSP